MTVCSRTEISTRSISCNSLAAKRFRRPVWGMAAVTMAIAANTRGTVDSILP